MCILHSSFLHVGGCLSSDKRWHREKSKVCRDKKGRNVIKAKVFNISHKHPPPLTPPKKKPNQTTRPKPKSEATAMTGCTKKHQDADANRCDHGPEVIPENGSYSSFSLTLLLNMLLVPAREKTRGKVSLWPEPVQMFQ